MPAFIDLTNHVYGKLTVLSLESKIKGISRWKCLCECGKEAIVVSGALRSGNTKSCGCLRVDTVLDRNITHGLSDLPEYSVWKDMKKRCYNKNNKRFKTYSEKGIIVADEFKNDFVAWLEHVGRRPDDGQRWSIGRIDNNEGYVRGNMEWQLDSQQAKAHSLQSNNLTGICGIHRRDKIISGRTYSSYVSTLTVDGVKYSKEFSINKYGEDGALLTAIEYREQMLKTYGKDFHPSHGTHY